MAWCLLPKLADKFISKLKDGSIDIDKLHDMTSQERRDFFTKDFGEANAREINALFESKLLLKNWKQGAVTWAKKVGRLEPAAQRDFLNKVNNISRVLSPAEQKNFLSDFVNKKLGAKVTPEQAQKITELAANVGEAKTKMQPDYTFKTYEERMNYGRAKVAFDNYVNDLKALAEKPTIKEYVKNPLKIIPKTAGLAKSLKASLDDSIIGKQGLKVLFTHPGIWVKNSAKTFSDMWKTFGGREAMDEMRAEVVSRPNAINGNYKKFGLAVGVREEEFPTSLPEKIPLFGRAFKASESAFFGFQYRTRADIFDKYLEIAEKTGADPKGIGILANSLTGRGNLGELEKVANTVNNVFFSPRFMKSNIDTLTAHLSDYSKMGSFAKRRAALNSLKIIMGIASVLAIADAVAPEGSVEWDPRSSNFGKIKSGNTRFDVSGGISPFVTLAARLITQSSKSSITNKVSPINSEKFGATTGQDVVFDFFTNKLSPAASVAKDLINQKDFNGNKLTLLREANNLFTPLPITTAITTLNDPKAADIFAVMIAESFGINTNTYAPKSKK